MGDRSSAPEDAMTDLDDEPRELFQLHGEAVEFLLRYEFVAKASPDKRDLFTQMISADNAGSISSLKGYATRFGMKV